MPTESITSKAADLACGKPNSFEQCVNYGDGGNGNNES